MSGFIAFIVISSILFVVACFTFAIFLDNLKNNVSKLSSMFSSKIEGNTVFLSNKIDNVYTYLSAKLDDYQAVNQRDIGNICAKVVRDMNARELTPIREEMSRHHHWINSNEEAVTEMTKKTDKLQIDLGNTITTLTGLEETISIVGDSIRTAHSSIYKAQTLVNRTKSKVKKNLEELNTRVTELEVDIEEKLGELEQNMVVNYNTNIGAMMSKFEDKHHNVIKELEEKLKRAPTKRVVPKVEDINKISKEELEKFKEQIVMEIMAKLQERMDSFINKVSAIANLRVLLDNDMESVISESTRRKLYNSINIDLLENDEDEYKNSKLNKMSQKEVDQFFDT
jgi:hypothetical protein